MKKIVSCALILAALSSVASICFAMNYGEIVTPEISPAGAPALEQEEQPSMLTPHDAMADLLAGSLPPAGTPALEQEEQSSMLTRRDAMADLFAGSVTPEIPQADETSMLTRQNAGRIVPVVSYEDFDSDENFHAPEWYRGQLEDLLRSITPQDALSRSDTPELPLAEGNTTIARHNAVGNLFAGFQDRIVTPVLPQDEEFPALTRQNAGPIVVDDNYDFTTLEMDLFNQ